MGPLLRLLGRFHPLTVHFPIAFLLAAGALEAAGLLRRKRVAPDLAFAALAAGAAASLVAAPLGWLDAAALRSDPADAAILGAHRWIGTSVAVASSLAALGEAALRRGKAPGLRLPVSVLTVALAIAVSVGAHFGGLLVYGRGYFFSAGPAATPAAPDAGPFERDILPIVQRHCARCHGARKQNARLRLDSRDAVLLGGKHGPAVVPGDSARSPVYRAITDPVPDTRMPQDAPPLPADEIDRIRRWIDQGAR
jgi:uncharacterized membrane protein